ncbi:MAG: TetR/AcrR family transcriptional regulator [Bradymonadia bacterium]
MDTREHILSAGEEMMKRAGYSGFSYADVSKMVGIRKASIHHHFPTKADLATAAVEMYRQGLRQRLAEVNLETAGLTAALETMGSIFVAGYEGPGGSCLCGSLAADWDILPEQVKDEVQAYWRVATAWIAEAISIEAPHLESTRVASLAQLVFSFFEGAMLTARVQGETGPLTEAPRAALSILQPWLQPSS